MELWPNTKTIHLQARRVKPKGHMILSKGSLTPPCCEDSTEYRTHLSKATKEEPESLTSKSCRIDLKPTTKIGNAGLLLVRPCHQSFAAPRTVTFLLLLYFSNDTLPKRSGICVQELCSPANKTRKSGRGNFE